MLSIQHLPPTLTKTPRAGAKQEVCHYCKNNHLRTFHRYDPPWRATHVFIAGRSNVDRMRGDSSSE
ncbi:hypothetical protein M405DRAFT_830910 [Rhizopogon salebrosus TDB-379]|nr:hypothetical protein M405DRAFT_830910 [Rhizopogon salebrosus TDB-379]